MNRILSSRFDPFKNVFVAAGGIEKYCTKCKKNKSLISNFSKDPEREYGHYSHCNECLNEYGLAFRQRKLSSAGCHDNIKACRCGLLYVSKTSKGVRIAECQKCTRQGDVYQTAEYHQTCQQILNDLSNLFFEKENLKISAIKKIVITNLTEKFSKTRTAKLAGVSAKAI